MTPISIFIDQSSIVCVLNVAMAMVRSPARTVIPVMCTLSLSRSAMNAMAEKISSYRGPREMISQMRDTPVVAAKFARSILRRPTFEPTLASSPPPERAGLPC